jgi:hypothetical protein
MKKNYRLILPSDRSAITGQRRVIAGSVPSVGKKATILRHVRRDQNATANRLVQSRRVMIRHRVQNQRVNVQSQPGMKRRLRSAPNQRGTKRRVMIRLRILNRATIRRRVQNQRRNNLNRRKATRLLVLNLRILSRPGRSMIATPTKMIRVSEASDAFGQSNGT